MSESFDKVSVVRGGKELDILPSQSLPKFVQRIIDAVIITDSNARDAVIDFFLKQGFNPRKLILWHETDGWGKFEIQVSDNTRIVYVNGLEFHIRNATDERALKKLGCGEDRRTISDSAFGRVGQLRRH